MPVEKKAIIKALEEAKTNSEKREFTQSVDLVLNLIELDLKKPDNRMNETVELPHPPRQATKIVVFATGDLALRARDAGADEVLGRETIEGFVSEKKSAKRLVKNTDFFIAETPLMSTVGKVLGPILGPRGKMPTPVLPNAPIDTVLNRHRRSVKVRIRDQLNVQCTIGTENMSNEELADNIQAVISRLEGRLPKGIKNIRELGVKTTMGPWVEIKQ